ncbi:unnamed protein product [Strongylus vulgaris]|uniref:Domain of unknown function DB domain-containing protein n=1 Tax=Strongylus vulgaris TaxID=40348 RepID=A0A3P7LF63_STRVU|nr:unnamed protein product [Strongylus vulgaris]
METRALVNYAYPCDLRSCAHCAFLRGWFIFIVYSVVKIFADFSVDRMELADVADAERRQRLCRSNGACGCCGCRAKAKARAANNVHLNGDTLDPRDDGNIFGLEIWNKTDLNVNTENIARFTNPNFLFHRCCEERRLPPACVRKCHFNTYEKEALEAMFVGTDECPIDFLPEMQFCAAQGMDHRKVGLS